MQYVLTPRSKREIGYTWWDNLFTKEELDTLQNLAINQKQPAAVGSSTTPVVNGDIRRSEVGWLMNNAENYWVFEKLAHAVNELNALHYCFNLSGFGEAIQLTNYKAEYQGTYGWHQDFGNGTVSRKLSLVLQLSDPNEYEGGQLQILTSKDPVNMEKRRGLITVFPSWTLHQVTPVTQGTRQSLVAWISGPAFI